MKCPVCEEEYPFDFTYCYHCGFNRLRTEFVNEEERQLWLKETVEPCQAVYETALERMDSLDEENDELRSEVDELQEKYDELLRKYETKLTQLEKKLNSQIGNSYATLSNKDGWNYDDAISHPNYAKCSYVSGVSVCEIYNISCSQSGTDITVNFLVKKISERGKNERVHFRWRLKDSDGLIVLTGDWIKDGTLVGDVIRGSVPFHHAESHRYSIDFIDV